MVLLVAAPTLDQHSGDEHTSHDTPEQVAKHKDNGKRHGSTPMIKRAASPTHGSADTAKNKSAFDERTSAALPAHYQRRPARQAEPARKQQPPTPLSDAAAWPAGLAISLCA
jgi:hypothetical protein